MIVTTAVSGSHVCVFHGKQDVYIDGRKARDEKTHIELVRGGMVRQAIRCPNNLAPDLIVEMMRNNFQPLDPFPVSDYQRRLDEHYAGH